MNGKTASTRNELRIAIIGSGFAGILMGIKLKEAGFNNFTIYDKAERLGGTWRDNTYPGCACDVPSMFYSYSFESKSDWTRAVSPQPEILAYLDHCAEKYGLTPHFKFNTEITEARFDEDEGLWHLTFADGNTDDARILVGALGQLNRPAWPNIPGMDDFEGTSFHSARWNHDHDLTGERVASVGNGASALQYIPHVAEQAKHLTIFQRSANWIIRRHDTEFSKLHHAVFSIRPVNKAYRAWLWFLLESRWPTFAHGTGRAARTMEKAHHDYMDEHIKDPELRKILTPDYPVGCKRVLISDNYFEAIARDNVEVVTDHIARITKTGVVTESGNEHEFDTIIYGTGFDTNNFLAPVEIYGAGGRHINDAWKTGAEAYLGLCTHGFPNFFMLYGPNTNLGHNSIIFMMECQVRYAIQCLEKIAADDLRSLDVREDAMRAFNDELQAHLSQSVWATSCESWYKNESGKIVNNWGYSTLTYWRRTRHPDFNAFDLVKRETAQPVAV